MPAARGCATGYTLIELVVVVSIVALLATFAVPTYRNYLLRSHRVEAKAALLALAAAQEKFYLQQHRYASHAELDTAPPAGLGLRAITANGSYVIAIDAVDAAGFAASATATGQQAEDTSCTVFTLNQAEVKGATSATCWSR